MQKGPWKYKDNTIVDANGNTVLLQGVGLIMATIGGAALGIDDSSENSNLVQKAPELNHVVGKVLDIMNNPYSNDVQRTDELFELTEELRGAYIDGADYDEE